MQTCNLGEGFTFAQDCSRVWGFFLSEPSCAKCKQMPGRSRTIDSELAANKKREVDVPIGNVEPGLIVMTIVKRLCYNADRNRRLSILSDCLEPIHQIHHQQA